MMNRSYPLIGGAFAVSLIVLAARGASAGGQNGALVRLQPSSPGVSQTGHMNLAGTATAGQFVGGGSGLTSVNADLLNGLNSSDFLQNGPNPIQLTSADASGTLQVANTAAGGAAVKGTVSNSTGGLGPSGIYGLNTSDRGQGVMGISSDPNGFVYGGYFQTNSPNGVGLYVRGDAASGSPLGGYFVSNADDGMAIYGLASGAQGQASAYFQSYTGTGVTGDSLHGTGVNGESGGTGVKGTSAGNNSGSIGVMGRTTSTTGDVEGVLGLTSSVSGYGVRGEVLATSGTNFGGHFKTPSPSGTGVYGEAAATSGTTTGGYFKAASTSGLGLYGAAIATTGTTHGVYGLVNSRDGTAVKGQVVPATGSGVGVWGISASGSGWGVYADGRLGASGTKAFRIDHPLDPLNKFLLHYCSEGPEPLNVYTGNVTTDAKGEAWVTLPDYFESINRDFRYTLTVVDDTDSDAFTLVKVARKIKNGRFKIRTSEPETEVTWRVEGIRNDAWMQKYGAPIEVDKPEGQKGKYQHPELYDAPPEMGMHYDKVAPVKSSRSQIESRIGQ